MLSCRVPDSREIEQDGPHATVDIFTLGQPELLEHRCDALLHGAGRQAASLPPMPALLYPSAISRSTSSSPSDRSSSGEPGFSRTSASSRCTIAGSSTEPPLATSWIGADQLLGVADAELVQVGVARDTVGEQRPDVLLVVVLGEDHDATARQHVAHLVREVDALGGVGRRHADVGDQHVRVGRWASCMASAGLAGAAHDDVLSCSSSSRRRPSRVTKWSSATSTFTRPSTERA